MSEKRKANTDSAYYLTFTVVGWIDIFTRSKYCDIVLKSLEYCRKEKGLEIFAFVIMPSHIHLIARHNEEKLNEIIRDFKSFTAKAIIRTIQEEPGESRKEWLLHMFKYFAKYKNQNKKYQFWQKTNHPTELFTNDVIDQKINYLHNNPAVAGIVSNVESYVYSSANMFCDFEVNEM